MYKSHGIKPISALKGKILSKIPQFIEATGLQFIGVELDKEMNNKIPGDEAIISTPESKVKVVIIPTDEELMIASDTQAILNK